MILRNTRACRAQKNSRTATVFGSAAKWQIRTAVGRAPTPTADPFSQVVTMQTWLPTGVLPEFGRPALKLFRSFDNGSEGIGGLLHQTADGAEPYSWLLQLIPRDFR